jgi:phage N-6-adenine-methyltransferase
VNVAVHFSSATDLWATPQDFFDKLHDEFGFQTDVCANAENAKCANYYTAEQDGLAQSWSGVCWMNPPYGRAIKGWMRKAYESAQAGATVVCLVPARTDTAWWWDYAMKGEVRFIRGRLKFGGHENNAPFPSAVVIFRNLPTPTPEPTDERE